MRNWEWSHFNRNDNYGCFFKSCNCSNNVQHAALTPLCTYNTLHTWLKSTKSGPVGLEKMDSSHFSSCSMQWVFQTPGVSIVHVQKTVSYTIIFSFRVVGPQSWVLRVTKLSRFLRYPQDTSHLLYFFHVQMNTYNVL